MRYLIKTKGEIHIYQGTPEEIHEFIILMLGEDEEPEEDI